MEVLTPSVRLPLEGDAAWEFSRFAGDRLPARDRNPLTPVVTEYNWARFGDRWPGIVDAFSQGYENPARLWPMPDADPVDG